jgi:hypothetical protein
MKPIVLRDGGAQLWMDNCGSHTTPYIKDHIKTIIGLEISLLPVNVTHLLQVLDLVVNGPIKKHIRTYRANKICDFFDKFVIKYYAEFLKEVKDRKVLKFKVPKTTLKEALLDLFLLFSPGGAFTTDKFKESIQRSFVKCGQCTDAHGNFLLYNELTYIELPLFSSIPAGTREVIDLTEEEQEEVEEALDAVDAGSDSDGSDDSSDDDDDK